MQMQVLSQLSYSPHWDVLFLDMQVSCVGALGGSKVVLERR